VRRGLAAVAASMIVMAAWAEAPAAPAQPISVTRPAASSPDDRPLTVKPQTQDRLDLDTTTITGNRELPKVMYVVPWKKADLGDLSGRPANSLLDEVLAPVDRDVFRRQLSYFSQIDHYVLNNSQGPTSEAHAVNAH
jgi:hypothetical protein